MQGDTGLIPGPGRFHMPHGNQAHGLQLLKPASLRGCAWQPDKPPPREAYALQPESSLHSPQLEKAHAQQWRPSVAKGKKPFS